ncbi:hypothetical protein ABZ687_13170 [Streptomyces ardesiacus]|uniref:hypothetical protein n=1 Tax=Streptomyces ardesiacus TaxID=285564 RepID=UPI0033C0248F
MVLSEALLLEVPGHVPTEQAALTKPLAVACHAVDRAGLRPDDVPLVVGCGPIGLAIITPLRMWSVGPIVAVDFSVERRRLAESLGADPVVDPAQNSPYEAWTRAPAPRPRRPWLSSASGRRRETFSHAFSQRLPLAATSPNRWAYRERRSQPWPASSKTWPQTLGRTTATSSPSPPTTIRSRVRLVV